jgi:hypothetical protein
MEDNTGETASNLHFVRKGSFRREKEDHLQAKPHLDFLAHYNAELIEINGTIAIVHRGTEDELPLEKRGKLQLLRVLVDEFVTVGAINAAIDRYKASHS